MKFPVVFDCNCVVQLLLKGMFMFGFGLCCLLDLLQTRQVG